MSGYDDYLERRRQPKKPKSKAPMRIALVILLLAIFCVGGVAIGLWQGSGRTLPGEEQTADAEVTGALSEEEYLGVTEALSAYMDLLAAADYGGMYEMLDRQTAENVSQEDFITRNQKIYSGIGAKDFTFVIQTPAESAEAASNGEVRIAFTQTMHTDAGDIAQDNSAALLLQGGEWKVRWSDALIFPDLTATDTIRISTLSAKRGNIYDRGGVMLAGTGEAVSVGLVPGKIDETSVARLAEVLEITEETIEQKLAQSWVTDDMFVPVATVDKLTTQELMAYELTAETRKKQHRDAAILEIPGAMTQETTVRSYPLGEVTAHLIGYVQTITTEELEADTEGVYNSNSQIGKVGLESLYEDRLRGEPGKKLRIVAENGDTKKVLATSDPVDGEDITLTIDSEFQRLLYSVYKSDLSCTAAINPYTGEVLALLSTPSYDDNAFVLGLTQAQWDAWNTDPATPLLNRFRQSWVPGSSFKPVTAAVGITDGSLDPDQSLGSASSWQASDSWGSYKVTTLHSAEPAKTEKALVVSDNVYFAKAAVEIGSEHFENGLKAIGFREKMPFAIEMAVSTFSNTDHIEDEIQLADSGYGQGQIQINPVHLLSIYSAFLNDGSMITPVLELSQAKDKTMWKENAFTEDAVSRIRTALRKVVTSGTATKADIDGLSLAGKTGTAEIKSSQNDTTGTELGWFTVYTTDLDEEHSILMTTMVENVKDTGGSGYVVERSADILRSWCLGTDLKGNYATYSDGDYVAEPYEEEELDPDSVPDIYGVYGGNEDE